MVSFKFEIPPTATIGQPYTVKVNPPTHAFTLAIYEHPRQEALAKRNVWRGNLVLVAQEGPNADGQLSIIFQRGDRVLSAGPYLVRAWAANEKSGQGNMAELIITAS